MNNCGESVEDKYPSPLLRRGGVTNSEDKVEAEQSATIIREVIQRGDESDVCIEGDEIHQIMTHAYCKGLNAEVLMASRKACLTSAGERIHSARKKHSRKIRVVAVDDEERFLELITKRLDRTGRYEIKSASNPYLAMGLIDSFAPDVAILDVMMPGTKGTEIVKAIRTSDRWSRLPVIMMTGLVGEAGRAGVASKGILYLAKTVSTGNLDHCIEEHLARSAGRAGFPSPGPDEA